MNSTNHKKTALITGGGSGIGRALAKQLDAAGYQIATVGRTMSKLEETSNDLSSSALCISEDIADPAACKRIVQQTVEQFGSLDVLANVAGNAPSLTVDQSTEETWRACIDTNLTSIVHLTAAAWDALKQTQGCIVNVSSLASLDPFPGFAMYAAAKAGVNLFTLVTAREGEPVGIRAVTIAPGAVETPMLRGLFDEQMIPKDAALPPEEVAQVMTDCITGKRAFTPGEVIQVAK